jgi:hypothetical protein
MLPFIKPCCFCQKPAPPYQEYCSFDCRVASYKAAGGIAYTPNGLPIRSFKYDGNMYEHEHGDHHDYKFPVYVKFTGSILDAARANFKILAGYAGSDDDVRSFLGEEHALIYTDGVIALTLYECNYYLFSLATGELFYGSTSHNYKLANESIAKIIASNNK